MRVVHLMDTMKVGGMEKAALAVLPRLRHRGIDAHLLYACEEEDPLVRQGFEDAGVPIRRLPAPTRRLAFLSWAKAVRALHPHVVQLHQYTLVGRYLAAALLARPRHTIVHFSITPERTSSVPPATSFLPSAMLRRVRLVLGCSRSTTSYFRDLYRLREDRTAVLYYGIDLASFAPTRGTLRPRYGRGEGHCVVAGFVGRLAARHKGLDVTIKAAALVRDRGVPVKFLLGGIGRDEAALRSQVSALGLEQVVEFAGRIDDVPGFLARCDLFVHPSRQEGLGTAIVEASAVGLPVVATKVGGIPEVVEDGNSGLLVPPDDPQAVAEAVVRLAERPDERQTMGEAGCRIAREKFDIERMVDELVLHYQRVAYTG